MLDLVERNFPETASDDVNLFARLILLGKLCETALAKRWCRSGSVDGEHELEMIQIVVNSESEKLVEMIKRILGKYSGTKSVAETRPYKYLQLLIIDHEVIREQKPGDVRKALNKVLPRLSAIEKFAALPEVLDHQLALDVMYQQYIFLEEKEWRKIMLNKVAQFVSRFGATQETLSLHSSIIHRRYLFSASCHPHRNHLVFEVMKLSSEINEINRSRNVFKSGDLPSAKGQSIFEKILNNIGDQERDIASQNERFDQHEPYQGKYIDNYRAQYPGTYPATYPGMLQTAMSQTQYPSYLAASYDGLLTAPPYTAPIRPSYNPFLPADYAYPPAMTVPPYTAPIQPSYNSFLPTDYADLPARPSQHRHYDLSKPHPDSPEYNVSESSESEMVYENESTRAAYREQPRHGEMASTETEKS
ncbi:hypothetical protein KCU78_g4274, partial [Aureobasidium melanogenum]